MKVLSNNATIEYSYTPTTTTHTSSDWTTISGTGDKVFLKHDKDRKWIWIGDDSDKKDGKRMLYEVFIVDPSSDKPVVHHSYIVCDGEDMAKVKAVVQAQKDNASFHGEDVDDYDFIVRSIGEVSERDDD